MIGRPLRMAMVGGGPGAFIGPVHRMAAELDGRARLVAGVFSRDAERSRQAGAGYGIASDRVYPDVATMLTAEAARDDGVDFVTIATPNHTHLPIALAAIEAHLPVISDKPATATLPEALHLGERLAATPVPYALTYTYTGYPLIREAREIVARGDLGAIRKIRVDYPQGWLAAPVEAQGNKQAAWRTDPAQTGSGGCIADIGVHAFNLAEFVAGDRVIELLADLAMVVPGRRRDDDATILTRFASGARGLIAASQIATGARNDLRISLWGEKGGLSWSHEDSQRLHLSWPDRPDQIVAAGSPWLGAPARAASRLPAGHPEGFIEAFATIYRDFLDTVAAGAWSVAPPLCGIDEGIRSMRFVETALHSSNQGGQWLALPR